VTARGGLAWLVLLTALLQAGCASLPTDVERPVSTALTDTADTRLGQASRRLLAGHSDVSAVLLFERGTDAFLARLGLAELAEKSLDVQYYIWHGDTTGKVLADSLLNAADRGVRVRLLLDDIGTAADDAKLLALDSHPQIEVRLFNPVANRSFRMLGMVADFGRVNRRMHNKSFTADNQATIVGGRNIGDEYFEARPDAGFADLDLLAFGPAVQAVSTQFDRYWNSPAVYPISALSSARPSEEAMRQQRAALREFVASQRGQDYAGALKASGLAKGVTEGSLDFSYAEVRVLADDPAKVEQANPDQEVLLLPRLRPEFESLGSELLMVSPYFVPGDKGVAYLSRPGEARCTRQDPDQLPRRDRCAGSPRRLSEVPPRPARGRRRTVRNEADSGTCQRCRRFSVRRQEVRPGPVGFLPCLPACQGPGIRPAYAVRRLDEPRPPVGADQHRDRRAIGASRPDGHPGGKARRAAARKLVSPRAGFFRRGCQP
jgi:hypothetical protein